MGFTSVAAFESIVKGDWIARAISQPQYSYVASRRTLLLVDRRTYDLTCKEKRWKWLLLEKGERFTLYAPTVDADIYIECCSEIPDTVVRAPDS